MRAQPAPGVGPRRSAGGPRPSPPRERPPGRTRPPAPRLRVATVNVGPGHSQWSRAPVLFSTVESSQSQVPRATPRWLLRVLLSCSLSRWTLGSWVSWRPRRSPPKTHPLQMSLTGSLLPAAGQGPPVLPPRPLSWHRIKCRYPEPAHSTPHPPMPHLVVCIVFCHRFTKDAAAVSHGVHRSRPGHASVAPTQP